MATGARHPGPETLAFAYVKPHVNIAGTAIEVVITGKPRPGIALDEPPYDPQSLLPRTDIDAEAAE